MAVSINRPAGTNPGCWTGAAVLDFASSGVDGEAIALKPETKLVQVVQCTALNTATVQPRYSDDGGTSWANIEFDMEGRSYPYSLTSAAMKLPATFLLAGLPGGDRIFNLYASAAQSGKTASVQIL
jgi:hypothetical protein